MLITMWIERYTMELFYLIFPYILVSYHTCTKYMVSPYLTELILAECCFSNGAI
ncbi:MAG: hypothetical protein MR963_03175 [Bacteroidales bacterium]|nr:hypothetical protein [Bacteroidales bacterium]